MKVGNCCMLNSGSPLLAIVGVTKDDVVVQWSGKDSSTMTHTFKKCTVKVVA